MTRLGIEPQSPGSLVKNIIIILLIYLLYIIVAVVIIIIIIIYSLEFFTSALADGLSLEFE